MPSWANFNLQLNCMKRLLTLSSFLCFFLVCTFQLQAQDDPCAVGGYELSFATVDVDCKNGSNGAITVNSTGCDCFFSGCIFEWSDGQTFHTADNLPAGTYSVVVTHPDGCVLEGTVDVLENDNFIEDVIVTPIQCNGESNASLEIIQADLTGSLDIAWSTGQVNEYVLENLGPGEYEFTAENFLGCVETYTYVIEDPSPLSFETEVKQSCDGLNNGEVTIIPGGGVEPYVVFLNSELPTAELNLYDLNPGIHNLLIIDANNCQATKSIDIEENPLGCTTTGIEDAFQNLSVFPNPSIGIFNLQYEEPLQEISVFDVVGRQIQRLQPWVNQEQIDHIDITDQMEGIYFLVLTTTEGAQRTVKLTKE